MVNGWPSTSKLGVSTLRSRSLLIAGTMGVDAIAACVQAAMKTQAPPLVANVVDRQRTRVVFAESRPMSPSSTTFLTSSSSVLSIAFHLGVPPSRPCPRLASPDACPTLHSSGITVSIGTCASRGPTEFRCPRFRLVKPWSPRPRPWDSPPHPSTTLVLSSPRLLLVLC